MKATVQGILKQMTRSKDYCNIIILFDIRIPVNKTKWMKPKSLYLSVHTVVFKLSGLGLINLNRFGSSLK